MKEQIEKIDRLLAELVVKGDSVLLLADARTLLGQLYRMANEAEKMEDSNG